MFNIQEFNINRFNLYSIFHLSIVLIMLIIYLFLRQEMGPISPYGPKEFSRLSEEDILKQSDRLIQQHGICEQTENNYSSIRLLIAKINIYGQRHLLDHLKAAQTKEKKLQYLSLWRGLDLQNLDLVQVHQLKLFQNLIRKKIMRIDDEQIFKKIEFHDKYSLIDRNRAKQITERGEVLIRQGKVGVIIFVGCSATKGEQAFNKQFYTEKKGDQSLFQIIMAKLQQIGDNYLFPPTHIFSNDNNLKKIQDFISGFKYKDRIQTCRQNTHPILNLNGNICLRSKDAGEVIELPNGSGDFYHTSLRNVNILDKLRLDKIEYVACVDCQNILQTVIDPYVLGLLDINKSEYDLMYKCTYPQNQKQKVFRRVVMQNGVPKADTVQSLSSYMNYNSKYRTKNNQSVYSSPVWMNSIIFQLQNINAILKDGKAVSIFPQMVNYKMKYMNYWSPVDSSEHTNEACYVFEREISDLLINNLFRSKAIMVERQEEYLPVITEKKEYSWKDAYEEYKLKQGKKNKRPFYEIAKQNVGNNQINVQSKIGFDDP